MTVGLGLGNAVAVAVVVAVLFRLLLFFWATVLPFCLGYGAGVTTSCVDEDGPGRLRRARHIAEEDRVRAGCCPGGQSAVFLAQTPDWIPETVTITPIPFRPDVRCKE